MEGDVEQDGTSSVTTDGVPLAITLLVDIDIRLVADGSTNPGKSVHRLGCC